jgi:release factor glutamine methyltransferase
VTPSAEPVGGRAGGAGGSDLVGTLTWGEVAEQAIADLGRSGLDGSALDVRRIVEEVTGAEGADYLGVLEERVTVRRLARFDALVARRRDGEPLQYVLGRWAFRTLDLLVDRRVLIPRPETEGVADRALAEIRRLVERHGATYASRLTVVDLGTGSGAIGLALAMEQPLVDVWATDISDDALVIARANTVGIGRAAARVRLAQGSWFEALPAELRGTLAVVVANPPYVAAHEQLPPEVADWEPSGALVAGPTGREALEHLVDHAGPWLLPGGALVAELAPAQAASLAQRAERAGYQDVRVHDDLTGRPRVLVARSAERS